VRTKSRQPGLRPLAPVASSLERRLALDLLAVLEAEVPDADAGLIGLTIAAEAGRRAGQNGRSWGDREAS